MAEEYSSVYMESSLFIHLSMDTEAPWFMYTMGYSSAIRNDKYPPFASTWMELEGLMLSEVSQSEKNKDYMTQVFK